MDTTTTHSSDRVRECEKLRDDELDVIKSIYDGCLTISQDGNAFIYEMELRLQSPSPMSITIFAEAPESLPMGSLETPADKPSRVDLSLSHLPPIQIHLRIPSGYPLDDRLSLISIRTSYQWLSPPLLSKVRQVVLETIDECSSTGECALGQIFELASYDRFPFVVGTPERITLSHPTPELLATHLLSHNHSAANESFNQQTFACPICISTVKGAQCVRLEKCGHVTCRRCLSEFWTMSIQTGEFEKVNCVQQECVKAVAKSNDPIWSAVGEAEVRNVVGEELTIRWRVLREKRTVDRDPTIVRCPIAICQSAVTKPKGERKPSSDETTEPDSERLRICEACGFAFCLNCRRTWHGPVVPCKAPLTSDFVERYLALTDEDCEERKKMEYRYGKRQLAQLAAEYQERKLNQEWMDAHAMGCPGCEAKVEKSEGCNHMKCARCSMHFCFRCGHRLRGDNPYMHFSVRGSSCYGKLFDEQSAQDNEWQPIEGFEIW